MTDSSFDGLPLERMLAINELCRRHESSCRKGSPIDIERLLQEIPESEHEIALREMLPIEVETRKQLGTPLTSHEIVTRFPQVDRNWLHSWFDATADYPALPVPRAIGDYQIIRQIGRGGMGAVYQAIHQRMGRTVAVKVLRPELQGDPTWRNRFDREVRAAARLNHPHIVTALDAREVQGLHCLITEFVDGADLAAIVKKHGPLSIANALDCVIQVARGLEYAHAQGVIHRDIKPANLLRDQTGHVKILDMGLARILPKEDAPALAPLTQTGLLMGTPAYMAPEQARDTRTADARSDLYSLGCTLYFLLTGKTVYSHTTQVDAILSHLQDPIPSLRNTIATIPIVLDSAFQKLIAKQPADRFQTATELIRELETIRQQLTKTSTQEALTPARTKKSPSANRQDAAQLTAASKQLKPMVADPIHQASPTKPGPINDPLPMPAVSARTPRRRSKQVSIKNGLIVAAFVAVGLLVIVVLISNNSPKPTNQPERQTQTNKGDSQPLSPQQRGFSWNGRSSFISANAPATRADTPYTIEVLATPREFTDSNLVSWLGDECHVVFLNQGRWGAGNMRDGRSNLFLSQITAIPNQRVHIAVTSHDAAVTLFIDGQPVETSSVSFVYQPSSETSGLYLGGVPERLNLGSRFFHGTIHAMRISAGTRYAEPFAPNSDLVFDSQTMALYDLMLPVPADRSLPERIPARSRTRDFQDATLTDIEWAVVE